MTRRMEERAERDRVLALTHLKSKHTVSGTVIGLHEHTPRPEGLEPQPPRAYPEARPPCAVNACRNPSRYLAAASVARVCSLECYRKMKGA
jgi:hypothetical protein